MGSRSRSRNPPPRSIAPTSGSPAAESHSIKEARLPDHSRSPLPPSSKESTIGPKCHQFFEVSGLAKMASQARGAPRLGHP
jgi:hypothetical protein